MEDIARKAKEIALEVKNIARKTNRRSMFVIENTAGVEKRVIFPPIRCTSNVVAGVVVIRRVSEAREIARSVDGLVDIVLVDVEIKNKALRGVEKIVRKEVTKSEVFTAKLNDMTVEAADALIAQLIGKMSGKRVAVIGAGNIGTKLALKLVERGANVIITRRNKEKAKKIAKLLNIIKTKGTSSRVTWSPNNLKAATGADVVICFAPKMPVITSEIVKAMNSNGLLIDGGIGTIYPDAIKLAGQRGISVLRLDMRAGFAGGVTTILETSNLIKYILGKGSAAGIPIVAGGFIGDVGDIIVDNISNPMQVVGVADGCGGVLKKPGPEFMRRLEIVRREIKR